MLFVNYELTMEYVVCINKEEYEADLEIGKAYMVNSEAEKLPEGYISVFDESGEDYIYAKEDFAPLEQGEIPEEVAVQA